MVARNIDPTFNIPNKLHMRERIMRQNNTPGESTPDRDAQSTNSFIIAKDRSLIPVRDPELLEKIKENNTPKRD